MHTQHLPVNQRGQVKIIEDIHAVLPGVGVPVLAHAFLVEAVDLGGRREGGREEGWVSENVDAILPGVGVAVLAHAFLVEPIHLLGKGGRVGGR